MAKVQLSKETKEQLVAYMDQITMGGHEPFVEKSLNANTLDGFELINWQLATDIQTMLEDSAVAVKDLDDKVDRAELSSDPELLSMLLKIYWTVSKLGITEVQTYTDKNGTK